MDSPSPVVERRSRRIVPLKPVENIPTEEFNDDEEERSRYRRQLECDTRNNNSASDKRLSISEKSLSEHFQCCIQLAAENKINPKNAFNFKLIDLLQGMFNKKKEIKDFTEVTSSLDAGVKIYSCRVDNVHSDTMKMATTICSTNRGKHDENNLEEEADDKTKSTRRKATHKGKITTLANNMEQINRSKVSEYDGILHPILSNENYIINSAIFDSSKVCWHLNMSLNFWKSNTDAITSDCDRKVSVDFPSIPDDAKICATFENFNFGGDSTANEISIKNKISNAYDFHEYQTEIIENDSTEIDIQTDDGIDFEENSNEPVTQNEYLSRVMSSSNFVSDISKLILSEKSEYCYFNSQLLKQKWKCMRHWNPFKKRKEVERHVKTDKRKPIDFETFVNFEAFENEAKMQFTVTSTQPREKFLITPITYFNINKFFRLKVWREMYVIPTTNTNEEQPSDLEETINDYNYDNPNDSQHLIPEYYEDDYEDGNITPADIHEVIEKNAFIGDNLLEIPNKVSKIQITFMIKDKSINMKRLKSKIWAKIVTSEEKINEPKKHTTNFSNICSSLIFDKKSPEELTVPIIFNALLQLANDKNLFIFNSDKEGLSDCNVILMAAS